jgi:hypothetical protein
MDISDADDEFVTISKAELQRLNDIEYRFEKYRDYVDATGETEFFDCMVDGCNAFYLDNGYNDRDYGNCIDMVRCNECQRDICDTHYSTNGESIIYDGDYTCLECRD